MPRKKWPSLLLSAPLRLAIFLVIEQENTPPNKRTSRRSLGTTSQQPASQLASHPSGRNWLAAEAGWLAVSPH
ncbi:unnamed protein product, partial [Iphiclides podalirius]